MDTQAHGHVHNTHAHSISPITFIWLCDHQAGSFRAVHAHLGLVSQIPRHWRQSRQIWAQECVCVCMLSHFSRVQLFTTLWTVARQAPLSMGILQAKTLEWVAMPSSRGSSWPRDRTCISHIHLLHWQAGSLPLVLPGKPMRSLRTVLLLSYTEPG